MTGVELVKADDMPRDLMMEVVPGCPLVSVNCTLGSAFCNIWSIRPVGSLSSSAEESLVMLDERRRLETAPPCPVTTISLRLLFHTYCVSTGVTSEATGPLSAMAPTGAKRMATNRNNSFLILFL